MSWEWESYLSYSQGRTCWISNLPSLATEFCLGPETSLQLLLKWLKAFAEEPWKVCRALCLSFSSCQSLPSCLHQVGVLSQTPARPPVFLLSTSEEPCGRAYGWLFLLFSGMSHQHINPHLAFNNSFTFLLVSSFLFLLLSFSHALPKMKGIVYLISSWRRLSLLGIWVMWFLATWVLWGTQESYTFVEYLAFSHCEGKSVFFAAYYIFCSHRSLSWLL